ncbi:MAG TPA: glutamine amidotransferase [Candidatus Magasanikbacteria bacterium]|nr:glutamine amidotransferase [Candidatus Magasanikbacteria bacterium]
MKPFLILQSRPEDLASQNEFDSMLTFGNLKKKDVRRVRMEREGMPKINLRDYSGVIVGGGPNNVSDPEKKKNASQKKFERGLMKLLNEIVKKDFPYFGACYGFGTVIKNAGGNVSKKQYSENAGPVTIKIRAEAADDKLMRGLPKSFRAFVGHKEACFRLPKGAVWLAESAQCPYQMVRIKQNIYAAQFHPELDACEFCVRVDVYKNYGYFDPKDAEKLKKKAMREKITTPMEILRRFTEFYGS